MNETALTSRPRFALFLHSHKGICAKYNRISQREHFGSLVIRMYENGTKSGGLQSLYFRVRKLGLKRIPPTAVGCRRGNAKTQRFSLFKIEKIARSFLSGLHFRKSEVQIWQGRRDSNTQPTVLETATLPLSHSPKNIYHHIL